MLTEEQRRWISEGAGVVVENPNGVDRWEGRAIAIADHPTIIVELADGSRVSRPLAWAKASTSRRARVELLRQDHDRRGGGHLPRCEPMSIAEWAAEAAKDDARAERRRTRPFVSFYTTKLYDPDDWPDVRDEREWDVQSSEESRICGGSFATLEAALVCARLLALQHVLGWELRELGESPRGIRERESVCWCGWAEPLAGCHANDITAHVITAHPDHPVVRG